MPKPSAAATSRTNPYWLCQGCGTRNERRKIKCANPDCNRRRPKKRVPKHARTLRDDPYPVYEAYSQLVHGGEPDSCRVCGRPRHERMNHHRDHDHVTGLPRGVVCYQCNALMPRLLTLERCRQVLAYLERDAAYRANGGLTEGMSERFIVRESYGLPHKRHRHDCGQWTPSDRDNGA